MKQRREDVSGLIPERYKELTVRVYTRQPHLLSRIQLAFRLVLENINNNLIQSGYMLEPESIQEHPDTETLSKVVSELDDIPIADLVHNPFLESPQTLKKVKSATNSTQVSPSKRLIEINHGLSIPENSFQKSLKKIRRSSLSQDIIKKIRQ